MYLLSLYMGTAVSFLKYTVFTLPLQTPTMGSAWSLQFVTFSTHSVSFLTLWTWFQVSQRLWPWICPSCLTFIPVPRWCCGTLPIYRFLCLVKTRRNVMGLKRFSEYQIKLLFFMWCSIIVIKNVKNNDLCFYLLGQTLFGRVPFP